MIGEGIISDDALVGVGRMARINVARAVAQIKSRRDIGQALGNGLGTRLDGAPPPQHAAPVDPLSADDGRSVATEDLIKLERLASERRRNRQAEEDDAKRRGDLMETAQSRAEMTRIASRMLTAFEGALPDMATALAARFELPQRDFLHELKRSFVAFRANEAKREAQRAEELPEKREMVIAVGDRTP
jgi:hypothetical protein